MLPGLAPASCAISRIETALKPLVENSTSAGVRVASRIFEFRVIGFDSGFALYDCTKKMVLSTMVLSNNEGGNAVMSSYGTTRQGATAYTAGAADRTSMIRAGLTGGLAG